MAGLQAFSDRRKFSPSEDDKQKSYYNVELRSLEQFEERVLLGTGGTFQHLPDHFGQSDLSRETPRGLKVIL